MGHSWALLGPSWGVLTGMMQKTCRLIDFCGDFGPNLGGLFGSSWEPLGQRTGASGCLLGASWRSLAELGLLGPLGSLLEALGTLLERLEGILAPSWEPCWSNGCPESEHVDFQWFYQILAGHLPWGRRHQGSEPEPLRGVARRHIKSLVGFKSFVKLVGTIMSFHRHKWSSACRVTTKSKRIMLTT